MIWLNAQFLEQADYSLQQLIADRGLNYGQAIFETMRAENGELVGFDFHLERLCRGAKKFNIKLPEKALLHEALQQAAAVSKQDKAPVVVKLLVTAGVAARGYATPANTKPMWTVSVHPLPQTVEKTGFNVITCKTTLIKDPLLFDVKHTSKIRQVLARDEVALAGADEGIMLNDRGDIIEATSANVIAKFADKWITPDLQHTGLPGTALSRLKQQLPVAEEVMSVERLQQADEIYLCNAIIGVKPVVSWNGKGYTAGSLSL